MPAPRGHPAHGRPSRGPGPRVESATMSESVHAVLFEGKDPRQGLLELMQREPKAELE